MVLVTGATTVDPYKPLLNAIAIAAAAIATILPPLGLYEFLTNQVGHYSNWQFFGLSAPLLAFFVVTVVMYLLIRRRGLHSWNVSSLDITIEYNDEEGKDVVVRREQTIYPNRSGVRAARIRVSSKPDIDPDHDAPNWRAQPVPSRALGRREPSCEIQTTDFRQNQGTWLYIHPVDFSAFPYPGLLALIRPRDLPRKFFHVKIEGTTTYRNSFLEDREYFELQVENPENPFIETVSFTLILPRAWADEPKVKLYRMTSTGLVAIQVEPLQDRVNEDNFHFRAETHDCTGETLRLDWRRPRSR